MNFPRELSNLEKELIDFVLPVSKKGYKILRDRINGMFVIGSGRFGGNNFILGLKGEQVDLTLPSAPVIAAGYKTIGDSKFYIVIHEESENFIEFDYQLTEEDIPDFTYSSWVPGEKAPGDGSFIREIPIIRNEVVLAIAPEHRRIWVYIKETGIIHFIPMANLYNEIMRHKNEKEPEIALHVERIFTHHSELTDEDIRNGFYLYNKYLKKIDLDFSGYGNVQHKKKKSFFNKFIRK